MQKLSIISHFYNHPEMVEQQVSLWKSIDPLLLPHIEFILVDDCSFDLPTLRKDNINLRTFKIISDIQWNQPGARNLAAFNASGEWGLFFDMDQQIKIDSIVFLLSNLDRLDKKNMYYLRTKGIYDPSSNVDLLVHPNTFLVNMQQFRVNGMYDEDFSGHYGYDDLYLPRVWEASGCKRAMLNEPTFFEDLGFGTTNFNRDPQYNKKLAQDKVAAGCKNSTGILRFEWTEVVLP